MSNSVSVVEEEKVGAWIDEVYEDNFVICFIPDLGADNFDIEKTPISNERVHQDQKELIREGVLVDLHTMLRDKDGWRESMVRFRLRDDRLSEEELEKARDATTPAPFDE